MKADLPLLWRAERAATHGTERLALFLILHAVRAWGFVTGRGIPS